MKILKAEFVRGVIGDNYRTKDNLPCIAFLGRSNVGKSSLINSLVEKKDLAKVGKLPGKTREANLFFINNSFYLIDFPGYGYAKRSIQERNKIIKRIFWYLKSTQNKPDAVFLIIDIKVGLASLDKEMINVLKENGHNVIIVANKIDKLSKKAGEEQISLVKEWVKEIDVLGYSARTNKGKEELIEKITNFL